MIPLASIFLSAQFQLTILALGLGLIILGVIVGKIPLSFIGLLLAMMPVVCWSLPLSIAGVLLVAVGIVLILLEILKHGALHGAGLGAGALYIVVGVPCMLAGPTIRTPGTSTSIVLCMAIIALVTFTTAVLKLVVDTLKAKPYSERMIDPRGRVGIAVEDMEPGKVSYVKICGEYWRAVSQDHVKAGEEIVVIDVREDGVLIVRKRQA